MLVIHDYCPGCIKAKRGCSSTVPKNDPRIDPLQEMHSRDNFLRVLDFTRPGSFCRREKVCHIRCLVCGFPVIMGFEPAFEEVKRCMIEGKWDEMRELTEECDARFAEGWNRPVHIGCAIRVPKCGCWIPRQANRVCPLHTKRMTIKKEEKTDPTMEDNAWAGLMSQMKTDAPKKALKKPIPTKPKKEDAWLERRRNDQLSLWAGFDEAKHGYFFVRGSLVYRHQNGRTYNGVTGAGDQFDQ
jgi:hypothetical protein